ncbi:hypothetical protein FACS189474_4050 [Bacteroidia bacterium]|nr:hypothetical protein FACS189474_4050 [Bacteroidia bacterium]
MLFSDKNFVGIGQFPNLGHEIISIVFLSQIMYSMKKVILLADTLHVVNY